MSFSNLNFGECETQIHQVITNTLSKYTNKTELVDPKNVVKDLTELDHCIKVIVAATFANSII